MEQHTPSTQDSLTDTQDELLDTTDLQYWGHPLTFTKPPDSMRLISQNPYGLDARTNYRKLDLLARNMAAYQVDVACLPETNADWKQPKATHECQSILRKHFKHHRLITSCSAATAAHSYLSGGTATIAANEWTGRLSESGADPRGLGRWSYIRTKGRSEKQLLIVTIYQVCKSSIASAGDSTAYSQQWHGLRSEGIENPDPRGQFTMDLSVFLTQYSNDYIIIAGDLNSWLRDPRDDKKFSALLVRHHLLDVLVHCHGPESEIPTRKEGRRIDYIFASEAVAQNTIRCGALHFDHMVDSDHRGLYLDVDVAHLLGGRPPTLEPPAFRGLDSSNPKHCATYLTKLMTYLNDHRVFYRTQQLEKWTEKYGLTDRLKTKWEALDLDITKGCLHAERGVKSSDRPAWSHQLHQAHLSVVYSKIAIRAFRRGSDLQQKVHNLLFHESQFEPPDITDLPTAVASLKAAKASLREIRKNAKAYRESFLEDRAAAAAAAQDLTTEQAINIILQREGTKKAYQTLKKYLRPGSFGSVTEVHVEKPDKSIEVISDPDEMFRRIIQRDLKHYHQAEGTPCTQSPIKEWLGTAGDTPIYDTWLHGAKPPTVPNCSAETQLLLDQLACATVPAQIDDVITIDNYKEFFTKWSESTSTSPDRHLGHWKALISHTASTQFPEHCDLIIGIIVSQMNLSLKHGYAWERWKRIISAKIPKRAGNMLLDKLRTIHLMEPDFNWLQGLIIGRRMIREAETNQRLHDNQWGSRPGRHAIGAVMLKVMSYEIARHSRTPLGSFDMDATACYDRIIIALAMYLCRQQGTPSGSCIMAATVLLYATYYIKTTHGLSPDFYSSTPGHPTHGPGQGSRIGPAIWVLVSCLMFAAMDVQCHGAEFCDPTGTTSHQRTGDGFVDDVANVFNFGLADMLAQDYSPSDIATGMQSEAQVWEKLLWATGGTLNLSKCFYYVIAWDFHKNGTPILLNPEAMPAVDIHLTSGDDPTPRRIIHTDTSNAHRTLGAHPNPSGCNLATFTTKREKSNQISEGVTHGHMGHNEALMGYRHIYLPSVGYALAAWPLTVSQLHKLTSPAVNAFLPKMGFCRNTSRKIIFGSKSLGGYGLTPMIDYQGVNQTTLFVQHLRLFDSVGKMLSIGYSWFQLYCGVSFPALASPDPPIPHAPYGWFTHLRSFLARSDISIDLPTSLLRTPLPLRRGDLNLMEAFTSLGWKTPKLRLLNNCRLYLQIETLAEISTPDGSRIIPSAWAGKTLPSKSTLLWPRQARPNSWAPWRQALAQLFLMDTTATYRQVNNLVLRSRLGRWSNHHSTHRRWPAYQSDIHLFLESNRGYLAHLDTMLGRLPSRSFSATPCGRHHSPHTVDGNVPAEPFPIRRGTIQATTPVGFFRSVDLDRSTDYPTNFRTHLQLLDPWESSLFEYHLAFGDPLALREHLQNPNSSSLYLAHDGGATDRGSFAWVIASATHIFWEGSGSTYGRTPGSFRAESYGMLAALRFLFQYITYFQVRIIDPSKEHFGYTDSQSLLTRLNSSLNRYYQSPGACLNSEFDLETAILATIKALPLTITRKHVAAHQDDKQPDILKLRWHVQLNIVCDRLASRHLAVCPLLPTAIPNPHCNAYIQVHGESLTGQIRKRLFDAAARPRMKAYLLKRYSWDEPTFQSIDWPATHTAIRSLSNPEHKFVTKFCFQQLPIGTRLHQRSAHVPASCPACDEPLEDDWHWLTCPSRAEWRSTQAKLFRSKLTSLKTEPGLKFIALQAFTSLLDTGSCDFTNATFSDEEALLVSSQSAIGWRHFLYGRCSTEWSRIQDQHTKAEQLNPKYYNGPAWTTKVIQYLWDSIRALWTVRNTDLHGTTFLESEATKRDRLHPLVRYLYDHIDELDPIDRAMLRMPLEDRLKQPVSVLITWLSVAQPAFDAARIREDPEYEMDAEATLQMEWDELELARALSLPDELLVDEPG
jgi:hypothetical protein